MLSQDECKALTVSTNASLRDALEMIDANQRRFTIVVDGNGVVVGTLTDGDIRRAVLRGASIGTSVIDSKACHLDFTSLNVSQGIDDAIEIFKAGNIEFLPVLYDDGRLANVLFKKQFYSLLLQCRIPSLQDDLSSVDENLVDFEIFNRPWGIYKTTVLQKAFQSKVLQVKPGGALSLQYHSHREEYWTIASGTGIAQVGESRFVLNPGSHVVIPRGCVHRLRNTSEGEWLVVIEVQIGDYFGEDDIVRIEDEYGRAGMQDG